MFNYCNMYIFFTVRHASCTVGISSVTTGIMGELYISQRDRKCVCICTELRLCARSHVCVDLCCADGLIILWTAALLVLLWMWQANKDWIKIKNIGGWHSESLQEKEMLSAVYLFHFLLIIGRLAAKTHIYIFSVMPKKKTHKILCPKFYRLSFHK